VLECVERGELTTPARRSRTYEVRLLDGYERSSDEPDSPLD
jgi:hypothetical protein